MPASRDAFLVDERVESCMSREALATSRMNSIIPIMFANHPKTPEPR